MAFKVCSSCGKHVRLVDTRCWHCKSKTFKSELVEGEAASPVSLNKESTASPRPHTDANATLHVRTVGARPSDEREKPTTTRTMFVTFVVTLTLSIAFARHLAVRSIQPQAQAIDPTDAGEDLQGKRIAEAKQARDTRARKAFADMKRAMQEGRWQDAYDLNVRVAVENPDFPGRSEAEREIKNSRPDRVARQMAAATELVDRQVAAATAAVGPPVGAHLCDNQDGHYRGVVASIHQVESPVMGSYTAYKLTNGEVVADAIVRVCTQTEQARGEQQ